MKRFTWKPLADMSHSVEPEDNWEDESQQAVLAENLQTAALFEGYSPDEAATIYVGHIPITVTEDELKRWFQEYGEIEEMKFRTFSLITFK